MRKSLTTVAAVLCLSILGACSSGGSDDAAKDTTTTTEKATTTTTAAPGVDIDEWATTFCTSLGTWLGDIKDASAAAGDQAKVGDAVSLQRAVGELYGTMSSATKTLIEEVSAQGAPDIEDGEDFQTALIGKYQVVDEAALDVQTQIEAAPTDDIATLQAKIDELGAGFQAEVEDASKAILALGRKYPSTELSAAIKSACLF